MAANWFTAGFCLGIGIMSSHPWLGPINILFALLNIFYIAISQPKPRKEPQ